MLQNKNAVVTGGSRGIGFAITKELISQGAKVVICSRNKKELREALEILNQTVSPNRNKGAVSVFGTICDVSKFGDCKKLIRFAKRKLEQIDILINNAGVYGPIGQLEQIDIRDWQKALNINLMGMVYCSHLTIPVMKLNGGGKIINLCGAGVGGNKTMPNFTAYFTAKSAIAGFSEVLADELREKNIQVNALSPGAVNTFLNEYLIQQGPDKSGKEIHKQALEQKREGGTPPQLAAKLIAFLASDAANHISGRLLSAKWNPPEKLTKMKDLNKNLFKLRRIDNEFFYEKK